MQNKAEYAAEKHVHGGVPGVSFFRPGRTSPASSPATVCAGSATGLSSRTCCGGGRTTPGCEGEFGGNQQRSLVVQH
eukprot:649183-Hanusia_phi.AAC.1